MKKISALVVFFAVISLPLFAQEGSWTKKRNVRDKHDALHDHAQQVRGDRGKWSEDPSLQHAPPIGQKPPKMPLDAWAEQLQKKEIRLTGNDDNWLIFRTKQLDDNDRVWVDRIERRGNQLTVTMHQAKWQGKYFRNFTYYQVIGVNLGKLEPGKYEVKWIIKPMVFQKFDGDGKPKDNWPKDTRTVDKKATELRAVFTVGKG